MPTTSPSFAFRSPTPSQAKLDLGAVYDPMRDEMFTAERGKGAYLNGNRSMCRVVTTELQKSLLVTGFPYDAWDTDQDNFANFVKFGKLTQGVRRLGSAALDLCYVAAGRFDGFWELSLKPWDVAAGGLICEEAGARVTNVIRRPRLYFLHLNPWSPPHLESMHASLQELKGVRYWVKTSFRF